MSAIIRCLVFAGAVCLAGALVALAGRSAWKKLNASERIALARERQEANARALCEEAGIAYPPAEIYLRAFKAGAELELWAAGGVGEPMKLLKTFKVAAQSGGPGPKRREGDLQVPEGAYRIVIFNPLSSYHLSLGLDYPNAADRIHADPEQPGSDIYIHGSNVSIGCLALGDDAIELLYLIAHDVRAAGRTEFPVHIFPARMAGEAWEAMRADHPQWRDFWNELQPMHDVFAKERRPPSVTVSPEGRYEIAGRD